MLARYSVKKAVLRIQLDFFGSGSVSGHKKSDPDPDGDTQILRSNDTFTEAVFLTIFYIEKNMFTGFVCGKRIRIWIQIWGTQKDRIRIRNTTKRSTLSELPTRSESIQLQSTVLCSGSSGGQCCLISV